MSLVDRFTWSRVAEAGSFLGTAENLTKLSKIAHFQNFTTKMPVLYILA